MSDDRNPLQADSRKACGTEDDEYRRRPRFRRASSHLVNPTAVPSDEEFVERHALVPAFLPLVALPVVAGAVTVVTAVAGDGGCGDCRDGVFGRCRDGGGASERDDGERGGDGGRGESVSQGDSREMAHGG